MYCDRSYADLLRAWASAGYVVAAVNFPLSDCLTGAAATESDLVNQPGDISYAITSMLRLSRARHSLFAGLLNPRQIAIAGQSDGGDTVAAIGANTCCTDHRVAAVAVLSGAEWPLMPGAFFASRPVPMLFTQGNADTVNLPGCSAAMYHADRAAARYYLDLFGADHTGPYWGTNRFEQIVARVTLAFFNRYVLGRDSAEPAMRHYGNIPGAAALSSHGGGHVPPGPCVT
jgi:predicted dienelactone hydrolase